MRLFFISLFALFLISCGGGSSSDSNQELTVEEQKQFILDVMLDYYLYYDQIPDINLANYATAEDLLDAIIVNPPDRFTYIGDRVAQENLINNGTFQGIGYGRRNNGDGSETILFVFDDSPAGRPCPGSSSPSSCLQRGDIVLNSVNTGNSVILDIDRNDFLFTVELDISLVVINTVLNANIHLHDGNTVAYLALSNFFSTTVAELDAVFADFEANNVDELILDLRYNGGGLVSTAQRLASYIAGVNGNGSDVARLEWNDRHPEQNQSFPFQTLNNQLDLDRVYVLTLSGTCSASELVINAMEGIGVDTITVGQTTCGKPVGSVSFDFGSKVLQPITFDVVNDLGNGGYFDGIDATCFAEDDTSLDLGNPSEEMYGDALYHILNGSCLRLATRTAQRTLKLAPQEPFNADPMANLR